MAAKDNTTKVANLSVSAREVDFVTRFGQNWEALQAILGIMRPIRKEPGTVLRAYTASVTLQSGAVSEGDEIPYSLASVVEAAKSDVEISKYAKGVSIEAVSKYGADIAVQKTDDAFLSELQSTVLTNFYTFLNTGSLTVSGCETWQAALAKAKGAVLNKFAAMRKTVTDVVAFANINDAYDYLANAQISIQSEFGLNYIKNFMGYTTIILCPDSDIVRGKVIAVPVENIDLYYIDPSDSDFAKLGLQYTVQGETNLIGFHVEGKYSHAVGESYALMGMKLWAEYLDGIAVATVTGVLPVLTLEAAVGSTSGKTAITYSGYTLGTGDTLGYKVTDDVIVVEKGQSSSGFTSWNGSADITAASGKIVTVVVINDSKVVAAGHVASVPKS